MRHQIKKKTHPLSILSQSEKFMVVCYRDLDSGEKFNAVGEKLCINCDCYLYGNIVSNQKGKNWESGFHKERMVYTQDELQIHEQENEYRSISINFKSVGNG